MRYNRPRHRVFVSCDERDDKFKARITKLTYKPYFLDAVKPVFLDCYFTKFEVQDDGQDEAEIIRKVREVDLLNASVLILLCGTNTKNNMQIDWQLRAAMTREKPLAIVVLNLPTIAKQQGMRAGETEDIEFLDELLSEDTCRSRAEFVVKFPYLPERIIDNLTAWVTEEKIFSISVIDWEKVSKHPYNLKQIVSIAYMRMHKRGTYYNIERPIMRERQ